MLRLWASDRKIDFFFSLSLLVWSRDSDDQQVLDLLLYRMKFSFHFSPSEVCTWSSTAMTVSTLAGGRERNTGRGKTKEEASSPGGWFLKGFWSSSTQCQGQSCILSLAKWLWKLPHISGCRGWLQGMSWCQDAEPDIQRSQSCCLGLLPLWFQDTATRLLTSRNSQPCPHCCQECVCRHWEMNLM